MPVRENCVLIQNANDKVWRYLAFVNIKCGIHYQTVSISSWSKAHAVRINEFNKINLIFYQLKINCNTFIQRCNINVSTWRVQNKATSNTLNHILKENISVLYVARSPFYRFFLLGVRTKSILNLLDPRN